MTVKKKPYKLPFELHDPKVEPPRCAMQLDLSDREITPAAECVLPQPEPGDMTQREL